MSYVIAVLLILIGDQAMKYWTSVNIPLNSAQRSFIPNVVDITNIHNSGAAFGILRNAGARWLFIVLAVAFVALVIWLLKNDVIKGRFGRWMLVMVMAGGVGNCLDRIVSGYVVDMFQFAPKFLDWFPVFNIADIFISVCGILFCIYLLKNKDDFSDKKLSEAAERVPRVPRPRRGEEPDPMADRVDYISQLSRPVVEGKKHIEAEKLAREIEKTEPQLGVGPGEWVTPLDEPAPAEKTAKRPARTNPFETLNNASAPADAETAKTDWANPFDETAQAPAPAPAAQPEPAPASEAAPDLFSDVRPAAPKKDEGAFSVDDIIAEFKDK